MNDQTCPNCGNGRITPITWHDMNTRNVINGFHCRDCGAYNQGGKWLIDLPRIEIGSALYKAIIAVCGMPKAVSDFSGMFDLSKEIDK